MNIDPGKLMFRNLPRDQRRQQMRVVYLISTACTAMAAVILFLLIKMNHVGRL